jgi:hypothetical protein
MSGGLRTVGDDEGGSHERCALCGGLAAGPCARCGRSVCGDCCELSEGGVRTWAVCLTCVKRGGATVGRGWGIVLAWVAVPVVLLAVVLGLLVWLRK